MKKMGRKNKEFNLERAKELVGIFCTADEVAIDLGISTDMLDYKLKELGYKRFSEFFNKYANPGKLSLRRKRFIMATRDVNPNPFVLEKLIETYCNKEAYNNNKTNDESQQLQFKVEVVKT